MEFQVSARKWRPQKFSELIGQEHIVRTLKNAIEMDRVAHAYLFSGTRGVGKTTSARLLAKALNCEQGPTPEPCDQCSVCVAIREGHCIDVLEIDGASNTGVDDVRALIENVQYSASACRYKVYIIDEVHMLSKNAFNALLKTLEEPPPQVVFIFATTELIKIPETILSRCQCFEFKPLSHRQIVAQLQLICEHDGIKIDRPSLEEIAKNGAGSMRDAQSLLDQVIAFCGKEVDRDAVESILGVVGQSVLEQFMDAVIARDGAALLTQVRQVVDAGKDLGYFCRDLMQTVRHLMLVKISSQPETLLDANACNLEVLQRQAEQLHGDELQQMFQALAKAEMDMKRSSLAQTIFEMAVLRLIDIRPFQDIDQLIEKINDMTPELNPPNAPAPVANNPEVSAPSSGAAPASVVAPAPASSTDHWHKIRATAAGIKRSLATFLESGHLVSLSDAEIHIRFSDPYTLGLVEKPENVQVIQDAVFQVCHTPDIRVKLDAQAPAAKPAEGSGEASANFEEKTTPKSYDKKTSPSEDEILKDALDIFGGSVIR